MNAMIEKFEYRGYGVGSVLASIFLSLGACSNYPLPQDVSGSATKDIVDNIRCEARQGLRETLLEIFRSRALAGQMIWRRYRGAQLADALEADPSLWGAIKVKDLDSGVRSKFAFYENSQIAYEFSLQMQESNTDSLDLSFVRPFLAGRKDAAGFSASAERGRDVKRIFNVVDTFAELALRVPDGYCTRPRTYNIVYPITGILPVKDLVSTYVYTNEFTNLGGPGNDLKTIFGTLASPAVPQMGDTIIFKTKLAGSVNPVTTLVPSPPGFTIASAGFKTDNYRLDTHQVIVVVSTSPDAAKLRRLDATAAPRLQLGRENYPANSRFFYVPPSTDGKLTDERVAFALGTISSQRQRSVDDAIIQIGSSLSQLSR